MSYIQARSDLRFIQEFREAVLELWQFEDQAIERLESQVTLTRLRDRRPVERQELIQSEASKTEGYQQARD